MELNIREGTLGDIDAVMRIESSGIRHPFPHKDLEALVNDEDKMLLVASYENDEVIGYIDAYIITFEAELGNICILPEYRGKGVGRALINGLMERLRSKGAEVVFLEVEAGNETAVGLYESIGFERYNIRKNYYGAGIDALLYKKEIRLS
ncbi:MAG: ribosomal protein S18-alanine N-acetyltransferase [Clostridiales bacterium]|nr:ribosomal protein S18-alanine N-acetyltransferase [Clostridiales bacterium]